MNYVIFNHRHKAFYKVRDIYVKHSVGLDAYSIMFTKNINEAEIFTEWDMRYEIKKAYKYFDILSIPTKLSAIPYKQFEEIPVLVFDMNYQLFWAEDGGYTDDPGEAQWVYKEQAEYLADRFGFLIIELDTEGVLRESRRTIYAYNNISRHYVAEC